MSSQKASKASRMEWVPLSLIFVDPRVQRSLNKTWVAEKAAEFDADLLGVICVNCRADGPQSGRYSCIDGQHRVELMKAVGWGDQKIQCEVFNGLDLAHEAREFLGRNNRVNIRTFDKFRLRIRAEDPTAVEIARIVRNNDLELTDGRREHSVCAVLAMEKIYKGARINPKDGPAVLSKTLKVLHEAWDGAVGSLDGELVEGVGLVLISYNGKVDEKALAEKLSRAKGGAAGVVGRAKAARDIHSTSLARCVGGVVVEMYNSGRRIARLTNWWQ